MWSSTCSLQPADKHTHHKHTHTHQTRFSSERLPLWHCHISITPLRAPCHTLDSPFSFCSAQIITKTARPIQEKTSHGGRRGNPINKAQQLLWLSSWEHWLEEVRRSAQSGGKVAKPVVCAFHLQGHTSEPAAKLHQDQIRATGLPHCRTRVSYQMVSGRTQRTDISKEGCSLQSADGTGGMTNTAARPPVFHTHECPGRFTGKPPL